MTLFCLLAQYRVNGVYFAEILCEKIWDKNTKKLRKHSVTAYFKTVTVSVINPWRQIHQMKKPFKQKISDKAWRWLLVLSQPCWTV